MNEYEVRVTRQALEQMKEIVHYISNDLMAPDAADNLLDKVKAEITKLSSFPKKYALKGFCKKNLGKPLTRYNFCSTMYYTERS